MKLERLTVHPARPRTAALPILMFARRDNEGPPPPLGSESGSDIAISDHGSGGARGRAAGAFVASPHCPFGDVCSGRQRQPPGGREHEARTSVRFRSLARCDDVIDSLAPLEFFLLSPLNIVFSMCCSRDTFQAICSRNTTRDWLGLSAASAQHTGSDFTHTYP